MANIVALLGAVAPNGLWEKIIFAFNGAFKNYALAIIILTICIKLLTLPIDYINRKSSMEMTKVQAKLKPKMDEIQRRYPNDRALQNQKMGELYQKEGFNPMGSCRTMLLVMVVTFGVFFTLFASLNNMAAYKVADQYQNLQTAYIQEYVMAEREISEDEFKALELSDEDVRNYIITINAGSQEQIDTANASVKEKYKEVKESFLWIKNVWIADSPTQKAIPNFDKYCTLARLNVKDLSEEEKEQEKVAYEAVMASLTESEGVNGYFILAILASLSAFLYQYVLMQANKKNEQKAKGQNSNGQPDPQAQSGKFMLIALPMIMLVFTLNYNAIFALYIIVSQLFGMATAPLIKKLIDKKGATNK